MTTQQEHIFDDPSCPQSCSSDPTSVPEDCNTFELQQLLNDIPEIPELHSYLLGMGSADF